jgi:xanthine dehydrogenase accessory factor
MDDWATAAKAALAGGVRAALVSILATEGSAPRGAGTRMLVTATGSVGTIGGGALEQQAIEQARALLGHAAGSWRVQDYPLGPLLGQCCGGRVRLLVEHLSDDAAAWIGADGVWKTRFGVAGLSRQPLDPGHPAPPLSARGERQRAGDAIVERLGVRRMPVLLFGAGHVGRAVARALDGLPVSLRWFDCRDAEAAADGVALVAADALPLCAAEATEDAAILIMTHDHGLDYDLTVAALRSPARFVGLIGSGTKRARFLSRLAKDGIDAARLTCPIGIAGVTGKEPAVIAVAVAAQLMQLYGRAA